MKKNEFGKNGGTTKTDNHVADVPLKKAVSRPKPAKKTNWNGIVLIALFVVWVAVLAYFGGKFVRSFVSGGESVSTETVEPVSNLQSPEATGGAQSPKPSSDTQSPEPTDGAQSPEPSGNTQSPEPSSGTQTPKPSGGAQTPTPTTPVQSPKPTAPVQTPKPTATPAPSNNNQTSNNGASSGTANADLIKAIREKYNYAQSNLVNCELKEIGTTGKAYFLDGRLLLLREYVKDGTETSGGKYNQHWYYDNGEVYFIFMTEVNTDNEYRLYFSGGKLIRWIDPAGKVYNSDYRWDEMQAFYDHAKAQCDSAAAN